MAARGHGLLPAGNKLRAILVESAVSLHWRLNSGPLIEFPAVRGQLGSQVDEGAGFFEQAR